MSGKEEGKSIAEGDQEGSPGRGDDGMVSNSSERVRVEDLMRDLSITKSRGLQPLTLEGNRCQVTLYRRFYETSRSALQG